MTLDQIRDRAKAAGRSPIRPVPPPEPSEAQRKLLMSIQWEAALMESRGHRGDLFAFLDRVDETVLKLRELLAP